MKSDRAFKAFIIMASLLLSQAARADVMAPSAGGAWDTRVDDTRGLLFWEELKGYRLFFHPEDAEPQRRRLTLALSTEERVVMAWAIIRPVSPQPDFADAWLRVEAEIEADVVNIQWDGTYRGRPFPDGAYFFEIHMKWKDKREKTWKVVILKSLDYPLFSKVGGIAVGKHPLLFRRGEFEPLGVSASFSLTQVQTVPMIARVFAPDLAEPFNSEGILVQGRMIETLDGKPVAGPWECLCQQALPADSPPRFSTKKVRCDWDLSSAAPGVWDLKLGLYHKMKHSQKAEPCDDPVLDEDRLRVTILP